MRISTRYQFELFASRVTESQERVVEAQTRVVTGRRINAPSDDPVGTGMVLDWRSIKNAVEQYKSNLRIARDWLGSSEGSFEEVNNLLRRANELAVRGANAATDQQGRNAMAQEVATIQQRLLTLANTKNASGQYVFSGQATATQPYVLAGATINYVGGTGNVIVESGPGQSLTVNTAGNTFWKGAYDALESLRTNLSTGNVGAISGVNIPAIQTQLTSAQQIRSDVGGNMLTVQNLESAHQRRIDELTGQISEVEDIDFAEAAMKYQQAQVIYQASLQITSQSYQLSLMDFIR